MAQCETVDVYGDQCRGWAYDGRQCLDCSMRGIPPCPDYIFTVVASDEKQAKQLLSRKVSDFRREYPYIRLVLAGESREQRWTKSRQLDMGSRQYWLRYALQRA